MENRFKELLLEIADSEAEFVVAGGVAAVLHGVERVTLDLDIALSFAPESVESFLEAMNKLGFTPRAPVPANLIADESARKAIRKEKDAIVFTFQDLSDPFWHVDVFLSEELSYDLLSAGCDNVDIEGRTIKVMSKQALLNSKLNITPPRQKDILDIEELKRLIEENS